MTGGAGGLGLITGGQEDAGEGQEVSLAVPGVVTAPSSLVTFLTAHILLGGHLLPEPRPRSSDLHHPNIDLHYPNIDLHHPNTDLHHPNTDLHLVVRGGGAGQLVAADTGDWATDGVGLVGCPPDI